MLDKSISKTSRGTISYLLEVTPITMKIMGHPLEPILNLIPQLFVKLLWISEFCKRIWWESLKIMCNIALNNNRMITLKRITDKYLQCNQLSFVGRSFPNQKFFKIKTIFSIISKHWTRVSVRQLLKTKIVQTTQWDYSKHYKRSIVIRGKTASKQITITQRLIPKAVN